MSFVTNPSDQLATKGDIYKALLGEVPGSNVQGEVEYFAALPTASTVTGEVYRVLKRTASYWSLGITSRYVAGFYESDGATWKLLSNAATPLFNRTLDDADSTNYRVMTPSDVVYLNPDNTKRYKIPSGDVTIDTNAFPLVNLYNHTTTIGQLTLTGSGVVDFYNYAVYGETASSAGIFMLENFTGTLRIHGQGELRCGDGTMFRPGDNNLIHIKDQVIVTGNASASVIRLDVSEGSLIIDSCIITATDDYVMILGDSDGLSRISVEIKNCKITANLTSTVQPIFRVYGLENALKLSITNNVFINSHTSESGCVIETYRTDMRGVGVYSGNKAENFNSHWYRVSSVIGGSRSLKDWTITDNWSSPNNSAAWYRCFFSETNSGTNETYPILDDIKRISMVVQSGTAQGALTTTGSVSQSVVCLASGYYDMRAELMVDNQLYRGSDVAFQIKFIVSSTAKRQISSTSRASGITAMTSLSARYSQYLNKGDVVGIEYSAATASRLQYNQPRFEIKPVSEATFLA